VVHQDVSGVRNGEDGWLKALEFEDGTVAVGDHGQTSVDNVYAVGDLVPGHNQLPVGLGEGAKASTDIHFQLRDFPRDPELLEEQGEVRSEEVPGIPDELLEQAVDFHTYE